jgi:transcriptional regulator of acetoin/glycerol metabolism
MGFAVLLVVPGAREETPVQIKQIIPEVAEPISLDSCDQPQSFREARERFERAYFANLLQLTGGNVSEAARLSGIARQNFYAHIKRLGIVTES